MDNIPYTSYSLASAVFMVLTMGYFSMCPVQNVIKLYPQLTVIEE